MLSGLSRPSPFSGLLDFTAQHRPSLKPALCVSHHHSSATRIRSRAQIEYNSASFDSCSCPGDDHRVFRCSRKHQRQLEPCCCRRCAHWSDTGPRAVPAAGDGDWCGDRVGNERTGDGGIAVRVPGGPETTAPLRAHCSASPRPEWPRTTISTSRRSPGSRLQRYTSTTSSSAAPI